MKSEIETISQVAGSGSHLPIIHSLRRYSIEGWICFGCLRPKHPTSTATLVEQFKTLMDTLGGPNHCFGKRLHWLLRVEGGDGQADRHLHFLLGGHKVTDGHYHPFYIQEVCDFLKANWPHGIPFVEPYQSCLDGVGYVTKIRKPTERDDYYELSHSLMRHLTLEVAA